MGRPSKASAALGRLRRARRARGDAVARSKLACLEVLEHAALPRAEDVLELHEALCFLRAYPDDPELHAASVRLLTAFGARRDLRRHREALMDTGIVGTDLYASFYWFTATWLARRYPGRLRLDWEELEDASVLEAALAAVVEEHEAVTFESDELGLEEILAVLARPGETDAEYLLRSLRAVSPKALVREALFDSLELPMHLAPGPGTPERTTAHFDTGPIALRGEPVPRTPARVRRLLAEVPRALRSLSTRDGRRMIELARGALLSRGRDLYAFMHADARDARLVDCGGGLAFACLGLLPERRDLLYGQWILLSLQNGVPVGYVQASVLFGSAEINFNVFDTFRDADSSRVFCAALALVRHLFGVDAFALNTQQLGQDNPEAVLSGAWWFYYKHGFRPADAGLRPLIQRELRARRRDRAHRSSRATLERLGTSSLQLFLGARRADAFGGLDLPRAGLEVARVVRARFGADGPSARRACRAEARRLLGLGDTGNWTRDERRAWERWAPLIVALPGLGRWGRAARRDLVAVVRAKGGRSEQTFLERFERHPRLESALLALARS